MKIKIPKKTTYLIIATLLFVVAFRLGGDFISNLTPSRSNNESSTKPIREIEITAKQFEFNPNPIRVKLGENIRLKITSIDVAHGFSLPEFGINEVLNPGQITTVEFQATKKGTFGFLCSVVCGAGHTEMRGQLIVE